MRLIVNDILTDEDKNAIAAGTGDIEMPFFDIFDIQKIKKHIIRKGSTFF